MERYTRIEPFTNAYLVKHHHLERAETGRGKPPAQEVEPGVQERTLLQKVTRKIIQQYKYFSLSRILNLTVQ